MAAISTATEPQKIPHITSEAYQNIFKKFTAEGFTFHDPIPRSQNGCFISREGQRYVLKVTPLKNQGGQEARINDERGEALILSLPPHERINRIIQRWFYGKENFTEEMRGDSEYVLDMSPFVKGKEVFELIKEKGPFSLETTLYLGIQVGETLRFLHDHGVVYRDLKLENLILNEKGQMIFVDSEFTRGIKEDRPMSPVGTKEYSPPEYYKGTGLSPDLELIDRVDSFAFGVTLFAFFTGDLPYNKGQRDAFIFRAVPIPNLKKKYIPDPDLLKLIKQLLNRSPRTRMTVSEATQNLKKLLQQKFPDQPPSAEEKT